jgi:methyl-accepting chemotaxis protein
VIDLLGPAAETQRVAAETQRAAAESTAQAFALVRDSATGIVEATRAIRDLIARQLEDAATVKISADALRAATDWLRQTGDAVQGVLSDDLPPLEAAIRDAVIRLREATDGLGVVVVDSSGRVEQQLQGIDQSLERVHSLIDGLRPIVSSGPEVAGLLDGLGGHFSRLTDGVTMLSGRFEDLSHNLHRRRSLFGG